MNDPIEQPAASLPAHSLDDRLEELSGRIERHMDLFVSPAPESSDLADGGAEFNNAFDNGFDNGFDNSV